MARFNYWALRQDLSRITGRPTSGDNAITDAEARAVKRDIARHQSLAEAACNYELTPRQQANDRGVERRLLAFFGPAVTFEGDPRGCTVKLDPAKLPLTAEDERNLCYFGRDWGGSLVFLEGGRR